MAQYMGVASHRHRSFPGGKIQTENSALFAKKSEMLKWLMMLMII